MSTSTHASEADWSKLAGWHKRARPHPNPSWFEPTRDALIFVVRVNAMGGDSIQIAAFAPNVVVDARGEVLELTGDDFAGLCAVAREAAQHPATPGATDIFSATWTVPCNITCQPNYHLLVPDGGDFKKLGIYAYRRGCSRWPEDAYKPRTRPGVTVTEESCYRRIPEVVDDFFGLAAESYDGYDWKVHGEGSRRLLDQMGRLGIDFY